MSFSSVIFVLFCFVFVYPPLHSRFSVSERKQISAHPSWRKPEAKKLNLANPSFIVDGAFYSFVDRTDSALDEYLIVYKHRFCPQTSC